MIDWLLWALFSANTNDGLEEWEEELDSYVKTIETMIGRKLESGRNPKVKSMRLTFDPVEMLHRPLIWYMVRSLCLMSMTEMYLKRTFLSTSS